MQTLIVGGGLSGLALADMLETSGRDYLLIDARDRFGGRVLSMKHNGAAFDLGPAWFWPGQPRIAALNNRLGLKSFEQYSQGDQVIEDAQGHVQRARGFASMQGSWRTAGGLAAITDALSARIPNVRKRLNAALTSLTVLPDGASVQIDGLGEIRADRVIFALPPRIVAELEIQPRLPRVAIHAMEQTAT